MFTGKINKSFVAVTHNYQNMGCSTFGRTKKERPKIWFSVQLISLTLTLYLHQCIPELTHSEVLPSHLVPFRQTAPSSKETQPKQYPLTLELKGQCLKHKRKYRSMEIALLEILLTDHLDSARWWGPRPLLSVETSLPPENLLGPPTLDHPFCVFHGNWAHLLCWWQDRWLVQYLLVVLSCLTWCLTNDKCSIHCCVNEWIYQDTNQNAFFLLIFLLFGDNLL